MTVAGGGGCKTTSVTRGVMNAWKSNFGQVTDNFYARGVKRNWNMCQSVPLFP